MSHLMSIQDNISLKHLYIHLNIINKLLIYIKCTPLGIHIYIDYIHQKDTNYHRHILPFPLQVHLHILANRILLINPHNTLFYIHTFNSL